MARAHAAKCREEWAAFTDEEIREYTPEKRCPSCERTLPSSEYIISRSEKAGLYGQCRTCKTINARNHTARRAGLPATLRWEEIGDPPDECPCCGQRMERSPGKNTNTSPSLDKIDPALGYTAQNSIWICARCNRKKDNWTPGDLYRFADWLYELYRERGIPCVTRLRPKEDRDD